MIAPCIAYLPATDEKIEGTAFDSKGKQVTFLISKSQKGYVYNELWYCRSVGDTAIRLAKDIARVR